MGLTRYHKPGTPGLTGLGFSRINADDNLYYKVVDGQPLILVLYIDDLFLTRDENMIVRCKRELAREFKMKDLGLMHYFLGLEVWQGHDGTFLGQGKYTIEILWRFGMMDCKSMVTPMDANLKKLHDYHIFRFSGSYYVPTVDWITVVP